jgi:hypothetical protein
VLAIKGLNGSQSNQTGQQDTSTRILTKTTEDRQQRDGNLVADIQKNESFGGRAPSLDLRVFVKLVRAISWLWYSAGLNQPVH